MLFTREQNHSAFVIDYYFSKKTSFNNYPSLINPLTIIKYQILETSFVTIKVFDVLGNEVETLVNKETPAGIYQVYFDGTKQSSGIYFYKLLAGKYVETKKLVLLK